MNKLLKDAILDAKAVRATALANAKVALEEAFAPKLQSMLSHKIKEEMQDEPAVEDEEEKMEVANMQKLAGIQEEEDEFASDETSMDDEASMDDEFAAEEDEFAAEDEASMEDEAPAEEGGEEEISDDDLAEILRELEGEDDTDDSMDDDDTEDEGYKMESDKMESEDPENYEMDEEIDLDEIIKALKEEDEAEVEEEEPTSKEELEEAYGVIKYLRTKLNEVNLLNAKLLFVNKLFKKGDLTEVQKVKVIETFDRAKNVREAKLIYATLSESMNSKAVKPVIKKKKVNEGLASAPQKKTQIITESNNIYDRYKSLVDYNKH